MKFNCHCGKYITPCAKGGSGPCDPCTGIKQTNPQMAVRSNYNMYAKQPHKNECVVKKCKCEVDPKINSGGDVEIVNLYTGYEEQITIPECRMFGDIIKITGVAGGGIGGLSRTVSNAFYSGGGGSAGESFTTFVKVTQFPVSIKWYVGRGGQTVNQSGENSWIEINGVMYEANGGTAANFESRGIKPRRLVNRSGWSLMNGEDGVVSLPSQQLQPGGKGGSTQYYEYGSGSDGMSFGETELNPAQDGIVIFRFSLKNKCC
jgi:hypothetical protein